MERNKISVVLGSYSNLDLTIHFVQDILGGFPDVEICLGVVGNTRSYQESLYQLFQDEPRVRLARGKEDIRVSFSETWNSAINLVQTERFVFLHNDMYVHKDFFENLNRMMDVCGPKSFYLYTTVEPLECAGFTRPGKIVAPFGNDFSNFRGSEFNQFANKYITSHPSYENKGYGFYLAGFTESLRKVGGFDYKSFYPVFCEDDDINIRLRLAGFDVRVAHQALVYHFGSKTIRTITGARMTGGEVESNRKFARKWGFEARYLWNTGYEIVPEVSIGTESIAYSFEKNIKLSALDVSNIEPLVDMVIFNPGAEEIKGAKEYFEKTGTEKKVFSEDAPEPDILITQVGPVNFDEFANIVGNLRYYHKHLKPGKVQIGSYIVEVIKTRPNQCRVDPINYLSLQRSEVNNG